MKSVLICFILVIFTFIPLSATRESKPHDGYWWGELSSVEKLLYMTGYVEGISDTGHPS